LLTLDQAGAGTFRTRRPPGLDARLAALAPWVEEALAQGPRPLPPGGWRIVPDPNPHVVVSVTEEPGARSVRAFVVGARSRAANARLRRRLTLVVRLRAGALPALTGEEARAFTDREVPLGDALGVGVSRLARLEELAAGEDAAGAMEELLTLLQARLAGRPGVDWRVRALDAAAAGSPAAVAARSGIPPRSLRAVAAAEVGLSPGRVLRIRRLQAALTARLHGGAGSWSVAAHRAGFHDPAHLVRTARALLGETPETFRARRRTRL